MPENDIAGPGSKLACRLGTVVGKDAPPTLVPFGCFAKRSFDPVRVYDTRPMYEALAASGGANIKIVIPPKKTATVDLRATGPWRQRNEAIERIGAVGRRQWRKESGAHRQAQAENGMYRYKRIIGDRLRALHCEAQQKEALIAVNVINRMTALGMPESAKIVA